MYGSNIPFFILEVFPLTWLFEVRRTKLVHLVPSSLLRSLLGFVFQTLNHEVLQLDQTENGR